MTDQSPLRPPAPDGIRRSLILAGGGMRVSYQAGVIRALAEAGLGFDHVDGTSGGTMNAAMLLSGLDAVQMCERWRTLDPKQFVSFMPPKAYLDAPDLPALGDARGLIDGVFPHLGISIPAIRAASGVLGTFNVCNFTRKVNRVVTHPEMDLDFLVAGVSLPIFMPAVAKDGELYMDSVWIRDANPLEAIRRGADELWIVWCIGNSPTYRNGIFNQYVHMIELSANGRLIEDFEQISAWNARIAAGEAIHGHRRPIRVHLIKPLHPLPLDPDYYLGRIDAATLIAMGNADAVRYLSNLPPDGILLQPEATAMTDLKPGLTFRETMSGGFSLSATDPLTGESSGAKTPMSMHASVEIDDVEGFIKDPAHLGSLSGTIDYAPLASGIPSSRGVFNLFSPTDQPTLKLMVYELGFSHQGSDYYLAGRKEVRDDPVYDLWKQTTTLYATLHEGRDASGPVVGAGVLHLGVIELVKLLTTMHATNTTGLAQSSAAIGSFGSFFLGKLWATYAPSAFKASG